MDPTPPTPNSTDPDVLMWPHELPYRVIFEEYRARRGGAFTTMLQQWGTAPGRAELISGTAAEGLLSDDLTAAENAYCDLDQKRVAERIASAKSYKSRADRKIAIAAAHAEVEAALRACQTADRPLKTLLHQCSGTALCLSGGGIRSASFSLGVLQGLAKFSLKGPTGSGFLNNLDFLSTVSGGGYIGSWLMGWARRSDFKTAIGELGSPGLTAGDPEPDTVRHLREYTSFLAPRTGFSVDTATLAAIFLRNLLLIWIIFLPCLSASIMLPRVMASGGNYLAFWVISWPDDLAFWGINWPVRPDQFLMICGAVLVAIAGILAARRVVQEPETRPRSALSGPRSERAFIAVTIAAAWFIVEAWIAGWNNDPAVYQSFNQTRFYWLLGDLFVSSVPMSITRLLRVVPQERDPFRNSEGNLLWGRVVWSFAASAIVSWVVAILMEEFSFSLGPRLYGEGNDPSPAFNILAVPIVMVLLMLGSGLLSGLLSGVEYEEEREWWGRAGGVFLLFLLAWIVAESVGWYSAKIVGFGQDIGPALWGSGSALFGVLAAQAGSSAASGGDTKHVDVSQLSKWGKFLARHGLVAPALSLLAITCIFLLIGSLNRLLVESIIGTWPVAGFEITPHRAPWILFAGAVLIAVLANFCININTFSLHGMYRMRLVRAFLGASNFGRNPDRFTNFDREDNLALSAPDGSTDRPVHVINAALNLVKCQNLAWQQRKAESFTLTPLRCGSWRLGYEPTSQYGGLHGITLGTGMAISGAAFNPNMGYNSSPLVTFVMTLFNARLGWWLPNPAWAIDKTLSKTSKMRYLAKNGPTFGLASIVSEALGNTSDRRKWIQLSDGGHFENLGLYEMVLRRCGQIVLVDASADRQFVFEDLGNAIRKINIDLGIPITFPDNWPFANKDVAKDRYCTVGEIRYDCVDSGAPIGHLVYFKPQLIGKEPRDVTAYADACIAFPHESTANQFFNEAQFESYRRLGSHEVDVVLKEAKSNDVSALLAAAQKYCE